MCDFFKRNKKNMSEMVLFKKIYCILHSHICKAKMNTLVRKGKNINHEKQIVEILDLIILSNFKACVMIFKKKKTTKTHKTKIDLSI